MSTAEIHRQITGDEIAHTFEEEAVPEVFRDDTPLNYKIMEHTDQFEVSPHEEKTKPSPEQIEANKKKWGWE